MSWKPRLHSISTQMASARCRNQQNHRSLTQRAMIRRREDAFPAGVSIPSDLIRNDMTGYLDSLPQPGKGANAWTYN